MSDNRGKEDPEPTSEVDPERTAEVEPGKTTEENPDQSGEKDPDRIVEKDEDQNVTSPAESGAEESLEPAEQNIKKIEYLETYTVDDAVNLAGYGKFQKVLTFLAGLGWLADAFEVIILSIIGDMIACEWEMRRWQNAIMTSSVFFGMTIGAPIFGVFADKYGRRTSLAVSMLVLFIFGAASAAAPSYPWIVSLRALMGFALGGIAQGVTLCCEYYPAKLRGRAGFYLSYYWALGTLGVIGAAWIVMQYMDNWRVFVFIAAVPALIVFLSMKWYPESARYYIVSNQTPRAIKTLERLAKMNKAELPKGRLVEMEVSEERGNIGDLFKPEIRRTTLLFWYIWLAIAIAYYGIALITPIIVTNTSLIDASIKQGNKTFIEDFTTKMTCVKFSHENFRDLMITSSAEFPGILIFTFTIEYCSRKAYLGTSLFILAFLILFLMLKMEPQVALLVLLFVCRGLVAAVFQLVFIMTTEAFPTTVRASAMGTGSACARIGGLIVPYLAQVAVITRPIPSIIILSVITALAGVAAFFLPRETRGRSMTDILRQQRC